MRLEYLIPVTELVGLATFVVVFSCNLLSDGHHVFGVLGVLGGCVAVANFASLRRGASRAPLIVFACGAWMALNGGTEAWWGRWAMALASFIEFMNVFWVESWFAKRRQVNKE